MTTFQDAPDKAKEDDEAVEARSSIVVAGISVIFTSIYWKRATLVTMLC